MSFSFKSSLLSIVDASDILKKRNEKQISTQQCIFIFILSDCYVNVKFCNTFAKSFLCIKACNLCIRLLSYVEIKCRKVPKVSSHPNLPPPLQILSSDAFNPPVF